MRIRFRLLILVLGLTVFLAPISKAQDAASRINKIQNNINNTKAAIDQLPDNVKLTMARERSGLERIGNAVNRMAGIVAKDKGKRFG
jgi:hypothetical protein